jgi:hypothetical protein
MQTLKKTFSSLTTWQCFAAILALLMITTPFAIYTQLVDKGPSWFGLDVSWKMTLNYAFIKNWIWGKDIVYTFGPLAFLSTRTGWGIPGWVFVLFDCFLVVNFYFVFADFIKNSSNKLFASAILICIILVVNQTFGSDLSWVMLFFIIYWMTKTFYDPRPVFISILILLTVLTFYIKMNTGVIAMLLLCLHLVNLFVSKKITPLKLLIYAAGFILLVLLSAAMLHVSIISYITGSLEIIKGYNDVMYLDEDHHYAEYSLYILFFAMMLWFGCKLYWQIRDKKYDLILYTIACMLYLFLLQKQSTLRNDLNHLYEYFSFSPLILLCDLQGDDRKKLRQVPSLVFILFALFLVSANRTIVMALSRRVAGPVNYIKQLSTYNSLKYADQQNKRYIPQNVLNAVSNKTVDVFPWDSEYAFENKLIYKPRPIFQSFSAYTEALEKINYNYYVKQAPKIIIYDYDSIDNRYPFNDESLVNLFIIKNYTCIDSFASNERTRLFLQRKNKTIPLQLIAIKTGNFALKDTLIAGNANFIKLDLQYNIAGKIKAFLSKPSLVQISFMREDGQWFSYKTSLELLRSGIYTGNFITNDNDFLSLLNGKHTANIKKIRLDINGRYFAKIGTVHFYDVY